jgi:AraC-like DNA-binding protein
MSLSVLLVRALAEAVERAGGLRSELLSQVTDAAERLEVVEGRFELSEFAALQERAVALTGDPALGLHMAEQTSESSFDAIAFLVGHAPTLRDAVAIAVQFSPLVIEGTHAAMRDSPGLTTIHCAFPRTTPGCDRFHAEFAMAGFVRIARHLAGAKAVPRAVSFEHDRPPYHREYTRTFGDVVRFGQSSTSVSFDRDIADRSQIHQSPELYSVVRADAERKLERVTQGSSPTELVRQYVLARPPSRIPNVTTAARDLGMSERSLRRHLTAENTSYRKIVQGTLQASACHMLRDPHRTIQETAVALGFVDARSFHRAFKAWTGMSPTQYRKSRGRG